MDNAQFFIVLGLLFLAGLTADQAGRLTRLPRVTMLLLVGLGAGKAGFAVVPTAILELFDALSIIALTMVAFLLGSSLTKKNLARHGKEILVISLAIVFSTLFVVSAGLMLAGVEPGLALILGAIATATAPAAMTDVIRQSGVSNAFTETLKGIVAIDDAWGLAAFSLALIFAGYSGASSGIVTSLFQDLGGGIFLGVALGLPAAFLTGRLKPGEPLQAEAIGVVFLTAGLSLFFDVSFLICGMTAGAIVANFAQHHDSAFHEIENLQWPFMILFFILGGAALEIDAIASLGWASILFVVLRIIARMMGGFLGAKIAGSPSGYAFWYGPALLPQAGVAIGMALVAGERFPQWAPQVMALTIGATVFFEILGPFCTLLAIRNVASKDAEVDQNKSV